jgi:hypothetical protein
MKLSGNSKSLILAQNPSRLAKNPGYESDTARPYKEPATEHTGTLIESNIHQGELSNWNSSEEENYLQLREACSNQQNL